MESANFNDKSEIEFMKNNNLKYNETGSDDRMMSGASKSKQQKLISFEVDEVLNKIGGFGARGSSLLCQIPDPPSSCGHLQLFTVVCSTLRKAVKIFL